MTPRTGAFERYIENGGTVIVMYDQSDPVVINSKLWVPAYGYLQSPVDIDGATLIRVVDAGHSGLVESDNETSKVLGRAISDFLRGRS